MTQYVPKTDFDAAVSGKETEVSSLQRSLEEAQGHLTNPQYLQFLASKKAETTRTDTSTSTTTDGKVDKVTTDRLAQIESVLAQQSAMLELQEVERKYEDFNDFRGDIHTLITSAGSNNLNFEQAYLIAKSQRSDAKPDVTGAKGKTVDKPAAGTEKPGKFVPDAGSTDRDFKNATEASNAALAEVKEKYGITGDTI